MIRVVAAVSSLEESNGRPVGRINGGAHVDVCLSRSPPQIRRAVLATGWAVCCGDQPAAAAAAGCCGLSGCCAEEEESESKKTRSSGGKPELCGWLLGQWMDQQQQQQDEMT